MWKNGEQLLRRARIIHRVPPDGEYTGIGERGIEKGLDRVVQFERFGFVRIDGVSGDGVAADFKQR